MVRESTRIHTILLVDVATRILIRSWIWQGGHGRKLEGHSGGVTSIALVRDGRTLVSGSWDGLSFSGMWQQVNPDRHLMGIVVVSLALRTVRIPLLV